MNAGTGKESSIAVSLQDPDDGHRGRAEPDQRTQMKRPYAGYAIRFPRANQTNLSQSEAFFLLEENGATTQIRFHDYGEIYRRPGLYEQLFYDRLKCQSPQLIAEWLARSCARAEARLQTLRVLDLGAGNGMMGEELGKYGLARLVGVDILPEARMAAERDRPGLYDKYYVGDLSEPKSKLLDDLSDWHFDCLTTVAALGFGDLPAVAFQNAFDLIQDGGWVAFNIKETFLSDRDSTGFSSLVRRLLMDQRLELHRMIRYQHRLSVDGMPLIYYGVIGRKRSSTNRG